MKTIYQAAASSFPNCPVCGRPMFPESVDRKLDDFEGQTIAVGYRCPGCDKREIVDFHNLGDEVHPHYSRAS